MGEVGSPPCTVTYHVAASPHDARRVVGMNAEISDDAVQAAAKAIEDVVKLYVHGPRKPWEAAPLGASMHALARAALETAAPAMLAGERARIAAAIEAKASDTSYTEAEAVTEHLLQAAQLVRGDT